MHGHPVCWTENIPCRFGFEDEDLATFPYVGMLFGWDAELRPRMPYVAGRLSHEGFLDLYSDQFEQLGAFQKVLEDAKIVAKLRP